MADPISLNEKRLCSLMLKYKYRCPKRPLTTLNLNNFKIKSRIAKPNTYLKTTGLHNFYDTKYGIRISFTRDL